MLRRSRLKKELVNLWTLKNKKLLVFGVVLFLGLLIVSKQQEDMPGDKRLSSGYSSIRGDMGKINNYANVMNYSYKLQQKGKTKSTEYILKNRDFSFLEEIDILEDEQYPQGLCITEDFVFLSSYSGIQSELGKIKVFDRASGELLISLGMDENSHLGGLTFDGTYIWVCNSSKMSIERISYSFIKKMVSQNRGSIIDARNLVDIYRVSNIPSCVTYYDGQLWVATHSIWSNSTMIGYHYSEKNNRLSPLVSFWIPPKVQGVTFTEEGEVYLSTSYGRKNSSYIKKYDSIYAMTNDVSNYSELIELPPCSEGIAYKDEKIYVLFESAGKKYLEGTDGKGNSLSPLDKILVIAK